MLRSKSSLPEEKSVVSWLEGKAKELAVIHACNLTIYKKNGSYDYSSASFTYTFHHAVQELLHPTHLGTRLAIEMRNSRGQNAFHCLFSNQIFTPLKVEWVNIADVKQVEGKVKEFKVRSYCQDMTKEKLDELLKPLTTPSLTYQHAAEAALFKALIAPYHDKDETLTDAWLMKDAKGTPLHSLFFRGGKKDRHLIDLIFARIKLLDPPFKKMLLMAPGAQQKTIMHLAGTYGDGDIFSLLLEAFGNEAFRAAFNEFDSHGQAPLHAICSSPSCRLEKMDFVRDLLTQPLNIPVDSKEEKVEAKPILTLFQRNSDGHNPIHLICGNSALADSDIAIITRFKIILGTDYLAKLKEVDAKGCTPVHFAAATDKAGLMRALLAGLSGEEKSQLMAAGSHGGETPLHFACRSGSAAVLREIILAMHPGEFFCQRKTFDFLKLVLANPKLSERDYTSLVASQNSLFDAIDYFIQRKDRSGKDFEIRAKNFYSTVVQPLEKGESVGGCAVEFKMRDKSILGIGFSWFQSEDYYNVRSKLASASQKELLAAQTLFRNASILDCTRLKLTVDESRVLATKLFGTVKKTVLLVADTSQPSEVSEVSYPVLPTAPSLSSLSSSSPA